MMLRSNVADILPPDRVREQDYLRIIDIMRFEKQSNTSTNASSLLSETMRIEGEELRQLSQSPTRAFLNVIRSRADLGVHVFIDGPTSLGRDPNCTVPLHDFGVSRNHAVITPQSNGQFVLRDLQSTNGTRINGVSITESKVLKSGEKIFIGDTVLRFAIADEMDIDFHSEVETLVNTDPLTGLPSKRRFDNAFEFALQSSQLNDNPLSLLMMDMDGVKQINDTHGHLFGAHVIGQTGRLIAKVIGTAGQACRFGGDEFSAFLPNCDLATAKKISEQIRLAVENANLQKDEILLRPTISIGVACFPESGQALLELVAIADAALYRAKDQGKNRVSD